MESSNAAVAAPETSLSSESSESLSESQNLSNQQGSLAEQEAAIDADSSLSKAEKAEAKKTLKSLRIKVGGIVTGKQIGRAHV